MNENYEITPDQIDTTDHFWDTFDHWETECSARCLVRMAQEHKSWRDFTVKEAEGFCKGKFTFNNLLGDIDGREYPIKANDNGTYSFTEKFVLKCFKKRPAKKL